MHVEPSQRHQFLISLGGAQKARAEGWAKSRELQNMVLPMVVAMVLSFLLRLDGAFQLGPAEGQGKGCTGGRTQTSPHHMLWL